MATTDDIILRIKVDEAGEQQKLVDLRKNINLVKEEQKKLAAAIKESGSATNEQIQKQLQLEGTLKDLQGEQRNTQRVMENLDKVYKTNEGSITQLRAKLSVLTQQWNDLSAEERENAEIGGLLEKRTKSVSDELKNLESRIGDNRRNVGNYAGALLSAADSTGVLQTAVDKLNQAQEFFAKLQGLVVALVDKTSAAKQSQAAVTAEATAAEAAETAATQANTAAKAGNAAATTGAATAQVASTVATNASSKSLRIFKIALASTGIGLILVALGALVVFLTKTQKGINIVNTIMEQAGAIVNVLADRFTFLGESIKEFFSGNFSKAADLAKKSAAGLGDEIQRETKLAGELSKKRQQLERDQINNIATSKRLLKEEEKLKNIRDNEFKSIGERQKANEQAHALEKRRLSELEDMAQRKVDLLNQEAKMRGGLRRLGNEQLKELRDAELELEDIREDSAGKENEFITSRFSLIKEEADLRKEAADKAREAAIKQLEAEAALLDIRSQSSLNSEQDILDLRLQIIQANLNKELLAEGLAAQQIKVLRAKAAQEEADLRNAYDAEQAKEQAEAEDLRLKTQLANVRKYIAQGTAEQRVELKKQRDEGLLDDQTYQEKLQNAATARMVAEIAALEQFRGKVVGIEEEITAKRLELTNYLTDQRIANNEKVEKQAAETAAAEKARLQEQGEATAAMVAEVSDLFAQSLTQQGMDMEKFSQGILFLVLDTMEKAATAAALQATLNASASALSSPDSVATFGIAGLAKAALITGLIKGAFALFKSQLAATLSSGTPSVFAAGGFTGSGKGAPDHTGFKVAGVVHEKEYVAPAWMVKHPVYGAAFQELEHIRVRGFASGGYTTLPRITAPLYNSTMMAPQRGMEIDYKRLSEAMANYKVVASVKEITSKTGKYTAKMAITNQ